MINTQAISGAKADKKKDGLLFNDITRLLIYLGLSFSMTYLWFYLANPDGSTWEEMGNARQSFVALGMLFPCLSHVLTRVITKEGFPFRGENNSYFGIILKDGKWRYFLAAALLPWIYTELGNVICLVLDPTCFDPEYYLTLEIEKRLLYLLPINAIVTGMVASFAAFGEEGGWRGYMMPKLLKLMGRNKALLVGGVIWGLWHAPLTCIGHNFGMDYPGFPYVGIVLMCVFCTLMGVLLTFLTERSGSVWPAVFLHGINNAGPSILNGFINPERRSITIPFPGMLGMMLGLLIVLIPVMILWKKEKINS